jgi:hypothetical protein
VDGESGTCMAQIFCFHRGLLGHLTDLEFPKWEFLTQSLQHTEMHVGRHAKCPILTKTGMCR